MHIILFFIKILLLDLGLIKKSLTLAIQQDFEKSDLKDYRCSLFFCSTNNQEDLLKLLENVSSIKSEKSSYVSIETTNFHTVRGTKFCTKILKKKLFRHFFNTKNDDFVKIEDYAELLKSCCADNLYLQKRPCILTIFDKYLSSTEYEIVWRYCEHIIKTKLLNNLNLIPKIIDLANRTIASKTYESEKTSQISFQERCISFLPDFVSLDYNLYIEYMHSSGRNRDNATNQIIQVFKRNHSEDGFLFSNSNGLKLLKQFIQTVLNMIISHDQFIILCITKNKHEHAFLYENLVCNFDMSIHIRYYSIIDFSLMIEAEENSLRTKIILVLNEIDSELKYHILLGYIIINNTLLHIKTMWSSFYEDYGQQFSAESRNAFFRAEMITNRQRTNIVTSIHTENELPIWTRVHHSLFFKITPIIDSFHRLNNLNLLSIYNKHYFVKFSPYFCDLKSIVSQFFYFLKTKDVLASTFYFTVQNLFYYHHYGYNEEICCTNADYMGHLAMPDSSVRRILIHKNYLDCFFMFSGSLIVVHSDVESSHLKLSILIYSAKIALLLYNIDSFLKSDYNTTTILQSLVPHHEPFTNNTDKVHFYSYMNQALYDLLIVRIENLRKEEQWNRFVLKCIDYCSLMHLWLLNEIYHNNKYEVSVVTLEIIKKKIRRDKMYVDALKDKTSLEEFLGSDFDKFEVFCCFRPLDTTSISSCKDFTEKMDVFE